MKPSQYHYPILQFRQLICRWLCVSVLLGNFAVPALCPAQTAGTAAEPGSRSSDDRAELDRLIERWRAVTKEAVEAGVRFFNSGREESSDYRKTYDQAVREGQALIEQIVPLAQRVYDRSPGGDKELDDFMVRVQNYLFATGQIEKSYRLGKKILDKAPGHPIAEMLLARAALMSNRFEEARELFAKHPEIAQRLTVTEQNLYTDLDTLINQYQEELAIQAKEAEADDLPRVELKTTKGTIVVELFENQAPETVGNFISLVESGFYTNTQFHRVIRYFMAQGGGRTAEGRPHQPDYTIFDEAYRPDIRRHFRGVISMAKSSVPHSARCEFFITTAPTLYLDGNHTAFGRVIEGMEVVEMLTVTYRTDPETGESEAIDSVTPDLLLSAKVLRKRDHEYKPNKTN